MSEHTTHDTDDEQATHDFDAFWAQHGPGEVETVRLMGEVVPVPQDVPLWVTLKVDSTDSMSDPAEVRRMVSELYGDNTLDRWADAGMGSKQLSTVLAWSVAKAQGAQITPGEAAERVEELMRNPPARNRQQRRAQGKGKKKGKRAS